LGEELISEILMFWAVKQPKTSKFPVSFPLLFREETGSAMQTILEGTSNEIIIDTDGPVVMIGEKINPTGHKKLAQALQEGRLDYAVELAVKQAAAGADILDVNVGVPGIDDVALLPKVVRLVAEAVDLPICLDSPNPRALATALPIAPGKPLVNSVNGEEASLNAILPLVKERGAAVIGLTLDDNGISTDPQTRLAIAGKIIERAARIGIPREDIILDPLVLTIGADSRAAKVTLQAVQLIRQEFGVNISLGASNVSFGLPDRPIINTAFLVMLIQAGATCMITDVAKMAYTVRAADLLLGRDEYAASYIRYYRKHPRKVPQP
jgi:5-methyltetrahydrofolate--homocysteine methyltransferase